ncbi:hypothetical protein FLL45_09955 [Aliikangiella marina]|uniref:Na+/H+ antiporter NhaC-like C-terminal domain-containing protein n=2 Tax=Aliikangiella marina TaxID=1712262 RepID=A0A545TEP0_9GAMM|nr:hypothetical protein FLL45_09955 [Aliikangiella marina]
MPAFPTLFVGALLGGLFAVVFQSASTEKFAGDSRLQCVADSQVLAIDKCSITDLSIENGLATGAISVDLMTVPKDALSAEISLDSGIDEKVISVQHNGETIDVEVYRRSYIVNAIDSVWRAMASGFSASTGDENVDSLLSRGGMESMLNPTVWLILCAMVFGAVLETVGLLQRLVTSALTLVKGTGSLVVTVITTCIGVNIIAADQYISIVLPGRMYRAEFKRRRLHPKNLSRVLEDSATITSPLIPWNTCGAFMAGTLGVSTFVYLPFCFFNLVNPIISIIYGITNFKIEKMDDSDLDPESAVGEKSEATILN